MKIDINKIEFIKNTDNIFQILHNDETLKFWGPKLLVPFGIDNEYNKYILRLELDGKDSDLEQQYFKKIILHIEKLIKKKLNIEDIEFKSVIKNRDEKSDLIECKIKTIKNNIITKIEYEDKINNYLKTIFDLPKQSYVKTEFEIYGLWDYRNEKKEKNKCGLIIYISNIIVLK